MDISKVLQNFQNNTASKEEVEFIKRTLSNWEIGIAGDVNHSTIVQGHDNNVQVFQLTPELLNVIDGGKYLGNLERNLTGEEIASGLRRLGKLLQNRAPILMPEYKDHAERLRSTLKTEEKSLGKTARDERIESLAAMNRICLEAVDISFNSLCLGEEAPKYDARSPFRGLESFRPEDSEFFFGREALTEKLVAKIKAHSFLAVLGASGSGKSSLVMAGVIPALGLDYAIIRPGENPLEALESAKGKALLVVDQFEELFTLTKNEDKQIRADFISAVLDFARSGKVIITLRSDFLSEVGAYRSLSKEIQNHLETILPMDTDGLRRAMEGQARLTKLEFEADLSQQILEDVDGEPGAMPLLQHALWELWNRRHGRYLRASEYRAFGGVKQAIASTAEQVFSESSKVEQEQLREIFLRLTSLDKNDEGRDTRRRVSLSGLAFSKYNDESTNLLLDKLTNARLIVKSVNGDKTEVEVVHEALIRHWERLRIWLNEDRDALRLRESVSESATEWERSGRHESLLNSRWVKLDEALLLVQDSRYQLTEIEQTYLKRCVGLRNREQRELERRLRYTVFVSIAAAVIFLALGSFGLVKSNESNANARNAENNAATAQANANVALARQLAAQAQSIYLTGNYQQIKSVLLATQSVRLFPASDAMYVLRNNILAIPTIRMFHDGRVSSVAISLDRKYIVSGSEDHSVRVWEVSTGNEIVRMIHDGSVSSVAFSPDEKYVASGSEDHSVRVWEVSTGKEVARVLHDDMVLSVEFSPDGKYVLSRSSNMFRMWEVTTGKDIIHTTYDISMLSIDLSPNGKYIVSSELLNTVNVWDTMTGKEMTHMTDGQVSFASFSPDSNYVMSATCDDLVLFYCSKGGLHIWDIFNNKEVAKVSHANYINSAVFSPDGKYIVSGSSDKTACVWTVMGEKISCITHDNAVRTVAFSFDSKYVVSGSADNTARVWEAATGKEVARMTHDDSVFFVAFSPDGKHVMSGSEDNSIRVWITNINREFAYTAYDGGIRSVAFSPDQKYVAMGGCDGSFMNNCVGGKSSLWEVSTGKKITLATINRSSVPSVAFSPDGKYVASAEGWYGTVSIRDVSSGKEVSRIIHGFFVTSVAFSPNGEYLVSGGSDGTARLWEMATGKEIFRMPHDGMIFSVAVSMDGKYVASAGCNGSDEKNNCINGSARVWEISTRQEISHVTHTDIVLSVAFSPDSKYLVTGSNDHTIRVWEVINGKETALMIHDGGVSSVAFNPDGKYIVSGSDDFTARVWDTSTWLEIDRVMYGGDVSAVAFSPDGKYVVSAVCDKVDNDGNCAVGTIHMWEYHPEDLITDACSRVTRNLTRVEWQQYIGDALPYQAVCPNLPIETESIP